MKNWWKLSSGLKLQLNHDVVWQNTDTCNANQLAITILAKCWQSSPWWPHRAIALPLPRSVCEPARRPWGWPAVEQVSTNEQPSWREDQERKKNPTIPLSFLKRPHRKNKTFPGLLCRFPLPLFQFHLICSCRAWWAADNRIQLHNELMFTINTSAEGWGGGTAEELQPKLCWVQDVTPPNTEPDSDCTILGLWAVCVCVLKQTQLKQVIGMFRQLRQ